ncbi:hypothetical protein GGR57DRAFT_494349 [Xylariaceae sp. FL1272]|nr:hypothetical protein GGR57DRAFT_494349 [Xylariaceae sp. FL1272]
MFHRLVLIATVLVALLAASEPGLSNVFVATAHALLERHPYIHVHFASFPKIAPQLARISSHARKTSPAARHIVLHTLSAPTYTDCTVRSGRTMRTAVTRPGLDGILQTAKDMQFYISPWTGPEHLTIYRELDHVIESLDPAVIVLDTLLRPAVDVTRDRNRLHSIISPNTLIDNFPTHQPWGGIMGSGLPFPIPWRKIPENIYLNIRFLYSVLFMPDIKAKQSFLKSQGLKDPINFYALHRPDVPWLTPDTPGASRHVDVIPQNVTRVGPISLSLGGVAEQDQDLAEWLSRSPTILINLGGGFMWLEHHAKTMAEAKDGASKYNPNPEDYGDDFKKPLLPFIAAGRLRMEKWLAADPTSILESGNIIASVHHGETGCYHEAIGSGVPQVILPQWLDLYNFAQMVEDIGVGTWGCRETSPYWTSSCLETAILDVVDGGNAV